MHARPGNSGFTLIELAIVLVIIGLLVGGVLVGQDLIRSAGINAVVNDIQNYNAAVATFRDKYGGIPGDLRVSKAAQAGLVVSATSPGSTGEGDGDDILRSGSVLSSQGGLGGENTLFWRQLSDAGLISMTSTATGAAVDTSNFPVSQATAVSTLTPLLPALRIRPSGFIHATAGATSMNFFIVGLWTGGGSPAGVLGSRAVLTPREAAAIDQKLDDSYPAGAVFSFTGGPNNAATVSTYGNGVTTYATDGGAPGAGICWDNTIAAPYAYLVNATYGDTAACGLALRFQS